MKTCFFYFLLCLFYIPASAQDQRTTFDGLSVVSTSSGLSAQLTWKKGNENIAFYVVERSTDGIDFKQCAIVFLSEDPNFAEYKFRDKISGLSNALSYRIGIINDQKAISYLPARKLIYSESL